MLFIPQEIKEKLTALEDENKRLQAENARLTQELASPALESKKNNLSWVLGILLLFAVGYIVFSLFFAKKETDVLPEEDTQAVLIRDGKIEKWNRMADTALVYRVQLGAYQDFNLDKYKQNIEGLYQDSIDGFTKISLGAFSRLKDAQSFQNSMVNLGLENVYIVAYENNKPIGLLEAKKKEQ